MDTTLDFSSRYTDRGACHRCAAGDHDGCVGYAALHGAYHGDQGMRVLYGSRGYFSTFTRDLTDDQRAMIEAGKRAEQDANPCRCRASGHALLAGTCRVRRRGEGRATVGGYCDRPATTRLTVRTPWGRDTIEVEACGVHAAAARRRAANDAQRVAADEARRTRAEQAAVTCASTERYAESVRAVLADLGMDGPASAVTHEHDRGRCTGRLAMTAETLAALADRAALAVAFADDLDLDLDTPPSPSSR